VPLLQKAQRRTFIRVILQMISEKLQPRFILLNQFGPCLDSRNIVVPIDQPLIAVDAIDFALGILIVVVRK
jgi:hypothetical protein